MREEIDTLEDSAEPVGGVETSNHAAYEAFISYRRQDSTSLANWVMQRLQRFKPPPTLLKLLAPQQQERFARRNRRYFLDREFQAANPHFWNDRLEPALRASRFLIVVTSREAFKPSGDGNKNWVVREIETFYEIHRDPRRIILLLGPGSDPADLPPSLMKISTHWDWVDLRDFKAGPRRWLSLRRLGVLERELMTIVATLFEVPTHLVPVLRQVQERRRRLAWTAATTTIATVLALLTLAGATAWNQTYVSRLSRAGDLARTSQSLAVVQDVGTAVLVALESLKITDLPEAEAALYRALSDLRERDSLNEHTSEVLDAHFSADAGRLLSIAKDETIRVWNIASGRQLFKIELQAPPLAIAKPNRGGHSAVALNTGQIVIVDASLGTLEQAGHFLPADAKQLWESAHFSPLGDALAMVGSAAADGRKEFSLVLGRIDGEVITDHKFTAEIRQLAWAPDGGSVAVGTREGKVYRVETNGTPPILLGQPDADLRALAFSGDGQRLLLGGRVNVQVLNLGSDSDLITLPRPEITVTSAATNTDGTLIALGRWDNCIELWDMSTQSHPRLRSLLNAPCRRDTQYPLTMNRLHFLPTGELLSASDDRRSIIWDTTEGYPKIVLAGHGDRLKKAVASADGTLVATITSGSLSSRHDIRLWSVHPALSPIVVEHQSKTAIDRLALSADETLLATAAEDGLVRVFLASNGREHMNFALPQAPTSLTFGTKGDSLFATSGTRAVMMNSRAKRPLWEANDATATAVSATEWGRTSSNALVVSRSQGLQLLDIATGTARRLSNETEIVEVTVAGVSDDGRRLAYGTRRTIVVVDAVSGKIEQRLSLQGDAIAAHWSPGGGTLLVTTAAPAIEIWSATEPRVVVEHKVPTEVEGISFDPHGRRAVVRTSDSVVVYDLATSRPLAKLGTGEPNEEPHAGAIQDARFSPDGEKVVTASYDRTAAIWRADTGRRLVSLVGHGDFVRSAQFTPDGHRVVTTAVITENSIETDQQVGASESKVIVWDTESGKPVAESVTLADQTVHNALVTRDGRRALTAHWTFGDQSTRTYILPLFTSSNELAEFAARQSKRKLTPEQRRTLVRE